MTPYTLPLQTGSKASLGGTPEKHREQRSKLHSKTVKIEGKTIKGIYRSRKT